ncbi:MAG TPA: hypothetical protein VK793_02180 [Steroidobacteraceae bacterium]|jgi:hypothetical protein|nr:hypothetical protein [Steroidobacteraceae bacterium]
MSSIANLGAASAALPQLNIHPHGHKKGLDALSTELSSSDSTAQLPVPAAQNLFSNLLQSLEQVIGLQTTSAAKATAAAAPGTGVTAAASTATAAASTSAATGNTLLQNYLHNAPQNVQAAAAKLRFNA